MPQKRNPISSETILAASKILRAQAGLVLDGMVSDFERASGPWHLEWVAIPQAFVAAVGALHQMHFALSGLSVNADAMMDNLLSTRGLIVAEAVMMGLAPHLGRQAAHDVVYQACVTAHSTSQSLLSVLEKTDKVVGRISRAELASLCNPLNYLGCCRQMADHVLLSCPPSAVQTTTQQGISNRALSNSKTTNGEFQSNGTPQGIRINGLKTDFCVAEKDLGKKLLYGKDLPREVMA